MPHSDTRPLGLFQFRLRSLFFLTLAVAIFSALVRILPLGVWYLLVIPVMPIMALSASILGVIYLRAQWRAFWLGFGTGIVQIIVLGFYADFLPSVFRGNEWEALLLIPFFVLVVPSMTGGIGVWFYVRGEAVRNLELQSRSCPAESSDNEANQP
jgi:hypothetical protein